MLYFLSCGIFALIEICNPALSNRLYRQSVEGENLLNLLPKDIT